MKKTIHVFLLTLSNLLPNFKSSKFLTTSVLFILMFTQNTLGCSVTGNAIVCPNDIKTYSITGCSITDPATYNWTITGNGTIYGVNGNNTVDVAWGSTGTGTVSLSITDVNGSVTVTPLNVTIGAIPNPVISTNIDLDCTVYTDEGGGTPQIAPEECFQVCEYSYVSYSVQSNAGSTYTWAATGHNSITPGGNTCNVFWGDNGNGTIEVTETNSAGCSKTVSVCITKVSKPFANFKTVPYTDVLNSPHLTICDGQPVYFYDISSPTSNGSAIISWFWDFGDGTTDILANPPPHIFPVGVPATYVVTLTVTNECGCSKSINLEVEVTADLWLDIACPTPVCENGIDTYVTNGVCSTYNWTVTNGTILSPIPYGNTIQVQWNNGASGIGIVSLVGTSCNTSCAATSSIAVPIFSDNAQIAGHITPCINSQNTYSLPLIPGASYSWTVDNGAIIVHGQSTHEILVDFSAVTAANVTIHCTYTNTFLECPDAEADMVVLPRGEFTIDGKEELCATLTDPETYTILHSWTGSPVAKFRFRLKKPNGTYLVLANNVTTYTFTSWVYGPGLFILEVDNFQSLFCNTPSSFVIKVNDGPPAPGAPTGDDFVCPGSSHIYSGTPTSTSYYLNWEINNDNTTTYATGNTTTVSWGGTTPYDYELILKQTDQATGCISATGSSLVVTAIEPVVPLINSYDPDVCPNVVINYSLSNFSSLNADQLIWSLSDPDKGSIVSVNNNGADVDVQWNDVASGGPPVDLILKVVTCGIATTYSPIATVNVSGVPPFTISPVTVCEGNLVTYSTGLTSIPGGATFDWNFNGFAETGATPNHAIFLYNTIVNTVPVDVEVTYPGGCTRKVATIVTVTPGPGAAILSSGTVLCAPSITSIALNALPNGMTSYTWYDDSYLYNPGGATVFATTQSTSVSSPGIVSVVVSDGTCSSYSEINISACSSGPSVPVCTYVPSPYSFTAVKSGTQCGLYDIQLTLQNSGLVAVYVTVGTKGYPVTHNGGNSYTVSNVQLGSAGVFDVIIYADYGTDCFLITEHITNPVQAFFTASFSCPSSNPQQYDVEFHNASSSIAALAASPWAWSSSLSAWTSTAFEPLTPLPPGLHNISLNITDVNNVSCTTTLPLNVPVVLDPTFTYSYPPLPVTPACTQNYICQNQTNVHFVSNSTTAMTYYWDYDDPGESQYLAFVNFSDRVFSAFLSKNIIHTVTDLYGCTYTSTQSLNVNAESNLGGSYSPSSSSFCPGSSSTIEMQPGLIFDIPTHYIWSNGLTTNPITVSQTGQYHLTAYDCGNGCQEEIFPAADAAEINVPEPKIFGDLLVCEGDPINISGDIGPYDYEWTLGSLSCGGCDLSLPSLTLLPAIPGTYTVSLDLTANGCTRTSTAQITVVAMPPTPVITPAAPVCGGNNLQLSVTNNGSSLYIVTWSNGLSGNTIDAQQPGVYLATFTNAAGCSASTARIVSELPDLSWLATGCYEFCSEDAIVIPGGGSDYDNWQWKVENSVLGSFGLGGSGIVSDLDLASVLGTSPIVPAGIYTVILGVKDFNGCESVSLPITIIVRDCPCHIEGVDPKITCVGVDVNGIAHYIFDIGVSYGFPFNGSLQLLPDNNCSGVTLDPVTNPNNLTGGFTFDIACIEAGIEPCFLLVYTDADPALSCTYPFCVELPQCDEPGDCELVFEKVEIRCAGRDAAGNLVYDILVDIAPPPPFDYNAFWSTPLGNLAGLPGLLPTGNSGTYTGTVTLTNEQRELIGNILCLQLNVWSEGEVKFRCFRFECFELPNCDDIPIDRIANTPYEPMHGNKAGNTRVQLHLIPNPAANNVTAGYSLPTEGGSLWVADTKGKTLQSFKLDDMSGKLHLNTTSLAPGVYYVMLNNSNNNLQTVKKLVIIK